MLALLNILFARLAAGESVVLALLVRSRGSTPQKTGAAMLVFASGQTEGTLGGGCTEAESRSRALRLLASSDTAVTATPTPPPELLTFKLDGDHGWDDGLICGGIMDVSLQLLSPASDVSALRSVRDALLRREEPALQVAGAPEGGLRFAPPPRLIIAGAGHVGTALARIAAAASFEVIIVDDREDCLSADRFPDVARILAPIETMLQKAPIDAHTYIVIVTRGHKRDAQALGAVIGSAARYVGLIGSRRKIRRILADLGAAGTARPLLERVHAPIGLNIGAITPAEIAISICAELIAVRAGIEQTLPMKLPANDLSRYLDRHRPGTDKTQSAPGTLSVPNTPSSVSPQQD